LNNGEDLAWPATQAKDFDAQQLILDADADTHFTADTDDRLDLALSGTDLFRWDGTATTPVNGLDWIASATGSPVQIKAVGSDSTISINLIPKGGAGEVQINGVNIAASTNEGRRIGLADFRGQTARAMAADIAGNIPLITQVSY